MSVLQKLLLLLAASVLLASGVVRATNDTDTTTTIYFAYITALSGEFVTSGTIPAVELALEKINDRQDLLPGYTLAIDGDVGDSKVSLLHCEVSCSTASMREAQRMEKCLKLVTKKKVHVNIYTLLHATSPCACGFCNCEMIVCQHVNKKFCVGI